MSGRIAPAAGHRALYAAFDVFPSAKGAATHIRAFADEMFRVYDGGVLYALGDDELPVHQREPGPTGGEVEVFRFARPVPNVLERSLQFGARLAALTQDLGDSLELAHFRDPFSGIPILEHKPAGCRTVYEVNGLPSIEMGARYPQVGPQTLSKIAALEDACLSRADVIVTPAATLKTNLVRRGVDADKIVVIENGADPPPSSPRPAEAPATYLVYVGGVQPWQGVSTLLRALARLRDLDVHLVICASTRPRTCRELRRLVRRLELDDRVHFTHRLKKAALAGWLRHAAISVAPLTACARNLEQGCCPLKVLESMAAGVPVVASDLGSVRELVAHREHAVLVHPERPGELARALRVALEHPDEMAAMAARARAHVEASFTWEIAREKLRTVYAGLDVSGARVRDDRDAGLQPGSE